MCRCWRYGVHQSKLLWGYTQPAKMQGKKNTSHQCPWIFHPIHQQPGKQKILGQHGGNPVALLFFDLVFSELVFSSRSCFRVPLFARHPGNILLNDWNRLYHIYQTMESHGTPPSCPQNNSDQNKLFRKNYYRWSRIHPDKLNKGPHIKIDLVTKRAP